MTVPATSLSPAGRASFASRAVVSLALITAIAALLWADATGVGGAPPAWWLMPVAIVVAVRGAGECAALLAARGTAVRVGLVQFAAVMIAVSAVVGGQAFAAAGLATPVGGLGWTTAACAAAIGLLWVAEIPGYQVQAGTLARLSGGVFAAVALGLPLAFMVGLRLLCVENLGPEARGPGHLGIVPLVSLVAVVKAGDICAYVVGSLAGRTKMAPVLSPGKTWEGAAASLGGALLAAWVVCERSGLVPEARPWGGWPAYGLAVGIAGMLGDLAESMVKRELGAKDSGRLFGGLGGVLDLVDSLAFAAPVAWLLWVLGR